MKTRSDAGADRGSKGILGHSSRCLERSQLTPFTEADREGQHAETFLSSGRVPNKTVERGEEDPSYLACPTLRSKNCGSPQGCNDPIYFSFAVVTPNCGNLGEKGAPSRRKGRGRRRRRRGGHTAHAVHTSIIYESGLGAFRDR